MTEKRSRYLEGTPRHVGSLNTDADESEGKGKAMASDVSNLVRYNKSGARREAPTRG
jgi:hypothetical protein